MVVMAPPIQPIEDRFWQRVSPEPNSGCWLWDGSLIKGYGQFKIKGRGYRATHISLMLHGRPRPSDDAFACHHCDVPACVNPDHLYWGSNSTNQRDAFERGRGYLASDGFDLAWRSELTHCLRGHEFTDGNTFIDTRGHRVCLTCRRSTGREFKRRLGASLTDSRVCTWCGAAFMGSLRRETMCCSKSCVASQRAAVLRGRRTHCKHGHEFAGDNIYITNSGKRLCGVCLRARGRADYQRQKERREVATET
jgi:hypothetical protein